MWTAITPIREYQRRGHGDLFFFYDSIRESAEHRMRTLAASELQVPKGREIVVIDICSVDHILFKDTEEIWIRTLCKINSTKSNNM